jgi:O-antigen ligase
MLVGSGCVIYVLFSLRSGSRRFKFIAVAALAVLFVVNVFPNFLDRSFGRIEKLMNSNYTAAQRTSARSDLAIGAWRLFLKHPLGVGTGGFKKSWATLEVNDLTSNQVGEEKAAHSAWGKVLAENGLPGFILFSMFVFSFAYYGFKQRRRGAMPIGVLVSVMLSCAFVATEFQSKGIWFISAATIVYLQYRQRHPGERGASGVRRLPVPLMPDSQSPAAVMR